MKLNNVEKFRIAFTGYNAKNYTTLGNYKDLTVSNATEGDNGDISISLSDGGNCLIYPNDEIDKQDLMKILQTIQKDFIGSNLEDLLDFEFILAERII